MTNAASIVGAVHGKGGRLLKEPIRLVFLIIKIAVLAAIIFLIWNHFFGTKVSDKRLPPATPQQVEKAAQKATSGYLSSGDLSSYQIEQQTMAQQYLINKDTADAERVMDDVFKNVPPDKIKSGSYMVMASVQKTKGDTAQYKHYLQLLVSKLKAEGNNQLATVYQKVLDGL